MQVYLRCTIHRPHSLLAMALFLSPQPTPSVEYSTLGLLHPKVGGGGGGSNPTVARWRGLLFVVKGGPPSIDPERKTGLSNSEASRTTYKPPHRTVPQHPVYYHTHHTHMYDTVGYPRVLKPTHRRRCFLPLAGVEGFFFFEEAVWSEETLLRFFPPCPLELCITWEGGVG